ncbi:MAG: hypothetical protein E7384_06025 [Ruminococcaceae bacterium]|nr:hypothetical protein [Oscillospiraceae bacterium]
MKLRTPVVVMFVMSLIVASVCVVYFWIGIPVLELIFNPADNTDSHGFITITGSDVLSLDNLHEDFVPDEGYEMQGDYTPVGELGKVTKVRGNQVKFAKGSKNVLLLGMSEESLCDSIFILNLNPAAQEIKIVSIPRDAYVPYSNDILNAMKKTGYYYSVGSCKINAAMYVGSSIIRYTGGKFGNSGIDFLCAVIDNLFAYGCEIDEYVQVDFRGFMKVIDIVGGVYVTSEHDMYKVYPDGSKEKWIHVGTQKLNSEKALFYVRNRTKFTSTGENAYAGGDEYRKENQVKFMAEVASQIVTPENLKLSNISDILYTLKDNIKHSMGDNLTEYVDIGLDFTKGGYRMGMYVVTGDDVDPFGDNAYYIKIY